MDNEKMLNSIKKLCNKNNISLSKLEKDIGLSQGLLSKWRSTTPSLEKLIDIAKYFSVSLDEVVGLNIVDDAFLSFLIENTENHYLKWYLEKDSTFYPEIKINRRYNDYDEDSYTETIYFTPYCDGFIEIYAFHEHSKLLSPIELSIKIQPSAESGMAYQNYEKEDLLPLWLEVLKSLGNQAPDQIKAEEYKQKVINLNKNKNQNEISDLNPTILNIDLISKFEKVYEYFSSPEFLKMMQDVKEYNDKNL